MTPNVQTLSNLDTHDIHEGIIPLIVPFPSMLLLFFLEYQNIIMNSLIEHQNCSTGAGCQTSYRALSPKFFLVLCTSETQLA